MLMPSFEFSKAHGPQRTKQLPLRHTLLVKSHTFIQLELLH